MTYRNFKNCNRRRTADKALRGKPFNIAKNPKYDGYPGVDPEILNREDALCQPPWLANEENFRFQMV